MTDEPFSFTTGDFDKRYQDAQNEEKRKSAADKNIDDWVKILNTVYNYNLSNSDKIAQISGEDNGGSGTGERYNYGILDKSVSTGVIAVVGFRILFDNSLTHAQELAEYGPIVTGSSIIFSEGSINGYGIEYGYILSSKGYVQYYHTTYSVKTTLSISLTMSSFVIQGKNGYDPTFSDWAGPVTEIGGNYGIWSTSYGSASLYRTYGTGVGPGLSIPSIGTGAYLIGTTYLDFEPTKSGHDEPYDNYNPAIPHL